MTRYLTKILLAASALTVLAAASTAYAAPTLKTNNSTAKQASDVKVTKIADLRDRSNRNRGSQHRSHSHRNVHHRDRSRSHRVHHRDYYRPARQHYNRRNYRHRSYHTPYRSNLGISFHFGTPGYSSYRWAPAAYSFYRPSYGSYGYYQRRTICRRINIEGWHHGHRELVSVKECSNPWDGTYIVQGSERVVSCRW